MRVLISRLYPHAAMALILMEMTSSPQQLPFLMLVLVLAKQVGDQFNYGVFEHQMMLKGLQVGFEYAPTTCRLFHCLTSALPAVCGH